MRVIGGLMLGLLAAVCQGQSQQMGSILQQAGVGAVSSSAEVGAENKVKDTKFSMDRGYYDSPFNVIVSTATEGATIVYTLDGSNPLTSSSAKSTPAPAEVKVDPASTEGGRSPAPAVVLRVVGMKTGFNMTGQDSQTYIFPEFIVEQSRPSGYPANWFYDYDIADTTTFAALTQSLFALPAVSLAGNVDHIFRDVLGFDAKDKAFAGKTEMVHPVTVEFLNPTEDKLEFQAMGGAKGHSDVNPRGKRSMRLYFDKKYQTKTLKEKVWRHSVHHNDTGTKETNVLVLRSGTEDALFSTQCGRDGQATYMVDQLIRDSQNAASGYGSRGFFVHLFLNGLYWGVYNVAERPDADFWDAYFGGKKGSWVTMDDSDEIKGVDPSTFQLLNAISTVSYPAVRANVLDIDAFADYMLLNFLAGVGEWPGRNYYAAHELGDNKRIRFAVWDAEEGFIRQGPKQCGGNQFRSNNGAWISPGVLGVSGVRDTDTNLNLADNSTISRLWRNLHSNNEFRVAFADSAQRNLLNGGALSDEAMQQRWFALADRVRPSMQMEAAKWGRYKGGGGRWTEAMWEESVAQIAAMMEGNAAMMLAQLQRTDTPIKHPQYFPSLPAPVVSTRAGNVIQAPTVTVAKGFVLKLAKAGKQGLVVFTTNGKDPRAPGGRVQGKVARKGARIKCNAPMTINARIKAGKAWSPLVSLEVFLAQDYSPLQLTEVMFHPDNDEHEYLELFNNGEAPVPLAGLFFSRGIDFTFPADAPVMQPGKYGVIVRNVTAFLDWYGPQYIRFIVGEFPSSKLSNSGETLQLMSPEGSSVWQVSFSDKWYDLADGQGHSLVLSACPDVADLSVKASWRPSATMNGSPLAKDPASVCDYTIPGMEAAQEAVGPITVDSCLGQCACTDLLDPYCCDAATFDATCQQKALSSPLCVGKC